MRLIAKTKFLLPIRCVVLGILILYETMDRRGALIKGTADCHDIPDEHARGFATCGFLGARAADSACLEIVPSNDSSGGVSMLRLLDP